MEKEIRVGLIRGRHPMPVDEYIFDEEIDDVMNFNAIHNQIVEFISKNCDVKPSYYGERYNVIDNTDVLAYSSDIALVVYVSGLTPVTASLISVCVHNGIDLTLMHYDRDTDTYKPQHI